MKQNWHCGNARCFSSAISESSSFEASLGAAQVPYFFLPGAAQVLALFLEYNDVDASFFWFLILCKDVQWYFSSTKTTK